MVRDARPRQFLGRKTLLGLILLLILLLIAGWLLYLKIGGGGTAISGGNGVKYDYHITGQIPRSAASCPELAPAEVRTLEFPDAGRMWLSGGVLYADATFTPYDQYKGELKTDGSFRLLSRGAAINGRFADDGTFAGTWDLPWSSSGCPTHMQMTGKGPAQWRRAFGGT